MKKRGRCARRGLNFIGKGRLEGIGQGLGGPLVRFWINFYQTNLGGGFAISFAGMKKPVKNNPKKTPEAPTVGAEGSMAGEYAHILAAELEVNPDFGSDLGDAKAEPSRQAMDVLGSESLVPSAPVEPEEAPGWNPIALDGPLELPHAVEALVFASEKPLDARQIASLLASLWPEPVSTAEVQGVLDQLVLEWGQRPGGFELVQTGGGYCYLTRSAFLPLVQKAVLEQSKRKLSVASLETLAIVAYKQPVSKSEVEQIRGVNCDFSIQKLLEKKLIRISGKGDGPGRPTLYSTSELFMDYFGINSIKQLPQLKDLEQEENRIGGEDEDAFETHVTALHAPSDEHDSSETNEALLETELSVTDDAEASENQTPTDSRDADETYS